MMIHALRSSIGHFILDLAYEMSADGIIKNKSVNVCTKQVII